MDRRTFFKSGITASLGFSGGIAHASQSTSRHTSSIEDIETGDKLNPGGIRRGGVTLVPVVKGKYKVWTRRIGKGEIKVLVLHGGPGGNHVMLEPLQYFLPEAGIELYFYDQLGCGYSDRPDDKSLWTLERYVQEVEEVRQGLGLEGVLTFRTA